MDRERRPLSSAYAPPVKRSLTIAGHETSLTLEPLFWRALEAAAAARDLPLNALVASIDAERITVRPTPNLSSAVRCWVLDDSSTPNQR